MDWFVTFYNYSISIINSMGVPEEVCPFVLILTGFLLFILFILLFITSKKNSDSGTKTKVKYGITPFNTNKGTSSTSSSSDYRTVMRHFSRTDAKIKINFTVDDDSTRMKGELIDISQSGLGFISKLDIEKDTRIRIILPNTSKKYNIKEFILGGSVVRIKPLKNQSEYGVHFFHVLKKESEMLSDFIQNHSKK